MDARARTVRDILHASDQYLIPFFQRNYSWKKEHWSRLWTDIQALLEDDQSSQHFLGPLVCTPTQHVPGRVAAYQLIDGQQRLTTLIVLLAAIRDIALEHNHDDLVEEITEDFLIHKRKQGLERYKVVPRLNDREALLAIVDGEHEKQFIDYQVNKAWKHLRREVTKLSKTDTLKSLRRLLTAITDRLALVVITIEKENPYEIFDSLNSTGLPLEESDLIRNYMFMQVSLEEQESFNADHWQPFENLFIERKDRAKGQTAFYRSYLMCNGRYSKPKSTFVDFRDRMRTDNRKVMDQVAELVQFRGYEQMILLPNETVKEDWLRVRLEQIAELDVSTANPLLINLIHRWRTDRVSDEELNVCLRELISFVIRRSICGQSTRPYHRWFPEAILEIGDHPVDSLQSYWSRRGWPGDKWFIECLEQFALYKREPKKCRLILESLEKSYGHKEKVDPSVLTIEHVMPQTVGNDSSGLAWQSVLGPEWFAVHQAWLHALGNLTLTGYNPDMSNRPFDEKKKWLGDSNLVMNRWFHSTNDWNKENIAQRSITLAKEVAALWPGPPDGPDNPDVTEGISRTKQSEFDFERLRELCIEKSESHFNTQLIEESSARFADATEQIRVVCLASKPYPEGNAVGYWFGFKPEQREFIDESANGYLALGCGSPDQLLLFPKATVEPWLDTLNVTEGRHWHISVIRRDNSFELEQPKLRKRINVDQYLLQAARFG